MTDVLKNLSPLDKEAFLEDFIFIVKKSKNEDVNRKLSEFMECWTEKLELCRAYRSMPETVYPLTDPISTDGAEN